MYTENGKLTIYFTYLLIYFNSLLRITYWRRSVVVSGVGLINGVNRHWARIVLGWVAACGLVNHLGM